MPLVLPTNTPLAATVRLPACLFSDKTLTIYDADNHRRVRGRRKYERLNRDSERSKFLEASMEIVDDMQPSRVAL